MNNLSNHMLPTANVSQAFDQQSYTDLNKLQSLKTEDNDTALKQVAKQFESFFMQMMMKSMRSANKVFSEGNFLESNEMEFHQDMYDNQLSLSLSSGQGTGLADVLYRQMKSRYASEDRLPNIDQGPIDRSSFNVPVDVPVISQTSTSALDIEPDTERKSQSIIGAVADVSASIFQAIKTPIDFVQAVKPYADKIAQKIGVDSKVIIAQAALETGWGQHVIKDSHGRSSLNLFNIKTGSSWDGKSVSVSTLEYRDGVAAKEKAAFRRYDSLEDSFNDFYQLLQNKRYQPVLANTDNPENFLNQLQKAGYATDPNYAKKILSIVNGSVLGGQ